MPLPNHLANMYRAYFAGPNANPQQLSILHLLRRDAAQCFSYDPNTYDVAQNPKRVPNQYPGLLWPGAMTVFTGIDLLGKFLAGVDEGDQKPAGVNQQHPDIWKYSVGGRFKRFAEQYMNVNANDAEVLYQARCAIAHSFSLWARQRNNGQIYSFTLDQENGNQLLDTQNAPGGEIRAIIFLFELHRRFQQAVIDFDNNDYYPRLEADPAEQATFQALVDHYGFIGIAQPAAFGW